MRREKGPAVGKDVPERSGSADRVLQIEYQEFNRKVTYIGYQ
jgi:hypothetical protein